MNMAKGVGYGKVILFGEHFVVHGCPAIAAGLPNAVIVEIEKSEENDIISDRNIVKEMTFDAIERMQKSMGIDQKYKVIHEGDLPPYGGLGSSAAFCVAMVRAISEDQGMGLADEEVNKHAFEGEKAFHGNPSGIDNTMATYGGVMFYKRGKTIGDSVFERIELGSPLDLAVSFTGKFSPTAKMVASVKEMADSDPGQFQQIFDEVDEIVNVARHALKRGKRYMIGALMNSNQRLLEEVGVSDETNDQINRIALEHGALGTKLTGGGGGGCCISLAKNEEHAQKIIDSVKKEGFESFHTKIS